MKFKIPRILNERQLRKAKSAVLFASFLGIYQMLSASVVEAADKISWDNKDWLAEEEVVYERGRIHYYSSNTQVCNR